MNSDNVVNFPKCRECQSEDTIAKKMLAEALVSGAVPVGSFLSLKQEVVALKNPDALGNIILLVVYRDACADCGAERITRVEKQKKNPALLGPNAPPMNRASLRHGFSPS